MLQMACLGAWLFTHASCGPRGASGASCVAEPERAKKGRRNVAQATRRLWNRPVSQEKLSKKSCLKVLLLQTSPSLQSRRRHRCRFSRSAAAGTAGPEAAVAVSPTPPPLPPPPPPLPPPPFQSYRCLSTAVITAASSAAFPRPPPSQSPSLPLPPPPPPLQT